MIAPGVFSGNIVEKAPAAPRQMKAIAPATGFPVAKPRARSKPITVPSNSSVAVSSHDAVSLKTTESKLESGAEIAGDDTTSKADDSYAIDNIQTVLSMTSEQMSDALSEISTMFSGKSIEFLRNRALKDKKSRALFGEREELTNAPSSSIEVRGDVASDSPINDDDKFRKMIIPSTIEELDLAKRSADHDTRANLAWTIDDDDEFDKFDASEKEKSPTLSGDREVREVGKSDGAPNTIKKSIGKDSGESTQRVSHLDKIITSETSTAYKTSEHPQGAFPLARLSKDRFDLYGRKVFVDAEIARNNVFGALTASPLLSQFMNSEKLLDLARQCVDRFYDLRIWVEPNPSNSLQPQDELLQHQFERNSPGYNFVEIGEMMRSSVQQQRALSNRMIHGVLQIRDRIVSLEAYGIQRFVGQDDGSWGQFQDTFCQILATIEGIYIQQYPVIQSQSKVPEGVARGIRRVVVFALLQLCASDLPPELPTLLAWNVTQRLPLTSKLSVLRCLYAYLVSPAEESAAGQLWSRFWGLNGCVPLPMAHARRPEITYEEWLDDCTTKSKEAVAEFKAENNSTGSQDTSVRPTFERFALLCRWDRVGAMIMFGEIIQSLKSSLADALGIIEDLTDGQRLSTTSLASTVLDGGIVMNLECAVFVLRILSSCARNGSFDVVEIIFGHIVKPLWFRSSRTLLTYSMTGKRCSSTDSTITSLIDTMRTWYWSLLAEICRRSRLMSTWIWEQKTDILLSAFTGIVQIMSDLSAVELLVKPIAHEQRIEWWILCVWRCFVAYGYGLSSVSDFLASGQGYFLTVTPSMHADSFVESISRALSMSTRNVSVITQIVALLDDSISASCTLLTSYRSEVAVCIAAMKDEMQTIMSSNLLTDKTAGIGNAGDVSKKRVAIFNSIESVGQCLDCIKGAVAVVVRLIPIIFSNGVLDIIRHATTGNDSCILVLFARLFQLLSSVLGINAVHNKILIRSEGLHHIVTQYVGMVMTASFGDESFDTTIVDDRFTNLSTGIYQLNHHLKTILEAAVCNRTFEILLSVLNFVASDTREILGGNGEITELRVAAHRLLGSMTSHVALKSEEFINSFSKNLSDIAHYIQTISNDNCCGSSKIEPNSSMGLFNWHHDRLEQVDQLGLLHVQLCIHSKLPHILKRTQWTSALSSAAAAMRSKYFVGPRSNLMNELSEMILFSDEEKSSEGQLLNYPELIKLRDMILGNLVAKESLVSSNQFLANTVAWPLLCSSAIIEENDHQLIGLSDWIRPRVEEAAIPQDSKKIVSNSAYLINALHKLEGPWFSLWIIKLWHFSARYGCDIMPNCAVAESLASLLALCNPSHLHRWIARPEIGRVAQDRDFVAPVAPDTTAVKAYCNLLIMSFIRFHQQSLTLIASPTTGRRNNMLCEKLSQLLAAEQFSSTALLAHNQQSEFSSSSKPKVHGLASRLEAGMLEFTDQVIQACINQNIDENVHAASLLVLMATCMPPRVRQAVWHELGSLKLLHLIGFESEIDESIEGKEELYLALITSSLSSDTLKYSRGTLMGTIRTSRVEIAGEFNAMYAAAKALSQLRSFSDRYSLVCCLGIHQLAEFLTSSVAVIDSEESASIDLVVITGNPASLMRLLIGDGKIPAAFPLWLVLYAIYCCGRACFPAESLLGPISLSEIERIGDSTKVSDIDRDSLPESSIWNALQSSCPAVLDIRMPIHVPKRLISTTDAMRTRDATVSIGEYLKVGRPELF